MPISTTPLPPEVLAALERASALEAINLLGNTQARAGFAYLERFKLWLTLT
jgi:hypothetical protein